MKHALLLLLVALTGCVSPLRNLRDERALDAEGATFTIKSNGQPQDVARVERALQKAPKELARWGTLRVPVTVYVVPNHAELETAVGRPGFGWLRAWARYDDVIFQAPSTWANDGLLEELVIHELTHCTLFQATGDADTWEARRIPLWFREGMAISTARQHHRYPSLEDSARWLEEHPQLDPFEDGERLSHLHSAEVYGVAVHAFDFLVEHHSETTIRKMFEVMRGGKEFELAFTEALGLPPKAFEQAFRAYMKARRFRDENKSVPSARVDQPSNSTQGRSETTPAQ